MEPLPRAERGTQAILVVDTDESIRRILDLSLRHAGFAVGLAASGEEAIQRLADRPDLVIATASDPDALELCRRVKQTTDRMPPAVVLISDPGLESKTRGLEAGADDFVVKPIYVQEVVARARALLQRRERERLELSAHATVGGPESGEVPPHAGRFVSDISDVPLVDLLRAIAAHGKSGVATITADSGARGEMFFRQGNVVDAEVGRLSGRDAVYRLFCWSSGRLEVEWKSIRRKDTIEMRPQDLLMEALRRVDDWRRLLADLPPLGTVLEVDYRLLAERLADIPDEVNKILRLCDGVRTILQVIDDCGLPDLDAAAAVAKLYHERIVHDARLRPGDEVIGGADMEGWLSEATGPFRSPPRLERDLFGASPEAGIGVHGRPTAPLDPLGEGTRDAVLDDDMRARFTDRLAVEGQGQAPADTAVAPGPVGGAGFPTTLQGLGTSAVDPARGTIQMPIASGELASSITAATSAMEDLSDDATPILEATPIVDAASVVELPPLPEPPPLPGAQPASLEPRSASGEIVVRPARAKVKQSPAAEVRLAHLREESARAFVRPSQSVTPPGSARALDEPPPLLEGPLPEPPTPPGEPESGPDVAEEFSAADAADELGLTHGRRGMLLALAVALLVLVGGGLWLRSRHGDREDQLEEAAAREQAAPAAHPSGPTILPLPSPSGNGEAAGRPPEGASPSKRVAATGPTHDELDERNADPKIARLRSADAAAFLGACRLAFTEARMKDAEAACTAARDANPDSAEAQGWLAHALFNRNRRREALGAAERAVKLNPKWADAYVIIGGVHQDAGEIDDAKRAYQRYLELDPHGQYAGDLRAIVDRLGKL